jgi:RNA polymerase sigma-70 factor (ECF subfamily)
VARELRCDEDQAHDSAIDAVFAYLGAPRNYQNERGRLTTFLSNIAKKRAIDRLRSRSAASKREEAFAQSVELSRSAPNERIDVEVEARRIWKMVESTVSEKRDRDALRLILAGEGSTVALAEALGVSGLSDVDRQREVKRNRDRLLKVLERLGGQLRDGDA